MEQLQIKIGANVGDAISNFNKLDNAVKSSTANLSKLPNVSNAATNSLNNLSRIAQDAPFGFIGISNNINPLLESFQRLQKESGSVGNTLKALGASLIGGGGLGLAVGIATSLLTVFSMRSHEAGEEVTKTSKEIDEAAEKEKALSSEIEKASSSVISQAKNLNDLKTALSSTATQVNALTNATVQQGLAQLLFNQKNEATQNLLQAQIADALRLKTIQAGMAMAPEFTFEGATTKDPFKKRIIDAQDNLRKLNVLSAGLGKTFASLFKTQFGSGEKDQKDNEDLKKELEEKKKILIDFLHEFEALKVKFPDLSKSLESFDTAELTKELKSKLQAALIDAIKQPEVPKEIVNDPLKFKLPAKPTIDLQKPDKKDVDEDLVKMGQQLSAAFTNAFQQGFEGIGQSIGEGIATGVSAIDLAAKSIGETMSSLLERIGKSLIQYGIVKTSLDKILSGGIAIPGGVAIAAGIAAIAASKILQASFKHLPGHATGLWEVPAGFPNDTYVARLTSGEMVLPKMQADKIRQMPNLFNDSRSIRQMKRMVSATGSMNVSFTGRLVQRGSDLVYAFDQSRQSQQRNFGR